MISLIPSIERVPRPRDITNFDMHGNVSVFRVIIEKCQGNTRTWIYFAEDNESLVC